jgi:hypothetical protein
MAQPPEARQFTHGAPGGFSNSTISRAVQHIVQAPQFLPGIDDISTSFGGDHPGIGRLLRRRQFF